METTDLPNVELETKPDFNRCMERIYAWYEGQVLDRPPVRFHRHNAEFESAAEADRGWGSLKERWFDAQFQVDAFVAGLAGAPFLGETFPIFWPNLGPDVYAAFFGMELQYGETTSWAQHMLDDLDATDELAIDWENEYLMGIDAITDEALARCDGRFLVGYTDLHPGVDCAASLRGNDRLCLDFYDNPEQAKRLFSVALRDFEDVYDHFDAKLKAHGQLSVSWMHVPSFGRMHIPSADFSALISPEQFKEFCLPVHEREIQTMDHNVFHVDGPGVARHIDYLLDLDKIQAYQWVQGVGDDYPIMQWVDFIRTVRSRGKSLIIDLALEDLEPFMDEFSPEGFFLWVGTADEAEQREVLRRLEEWT
jgi:hypothetical protein